VFSSAVSSFAGEQISYGRWIGSTLLVMMLEDNLIRAVEQTDKGILLLVLYQVFFLICDSGVDHAD
jgi:hypothetical protein